MKKLLFISLISLLFSCSSSYRVSSDYDYEANLQQYQTFQVIKNEPICAPVSNPIHRKRIERAIKEEMIQAGFEEEHNGELSIYFQLKLEMIKDVEKTWPYFDSWNYPGKIRYYEYQQGTLVLDIYDTQRREIIWHGAVVGMLGEKMNKPDKKIKKAVRDLIQEFINTKDKTRKVALGPLAK